MPPETGGVFVYELCAVIAHIDSNQSSGMKKSPHLFPLKKLWDLKMGWGIEGEVVNGRRYLGGRCKQSQHSQQTEFRVLLKLTFE